MLLLTLNYVPGKEIESAKKALYEAKEELGNAYRSMDEKLKSDRDYTYSELGRLIKILESIK